MYVNMLSENAKDLSALLHLPSPVIVVFEQKALKHNADLPMLKLIKGRLGVTKFNSMSPLSVKKGEVIAPDCFKATFHFPFSIFHFSFTPPNIYPQYLPLEFCYLAQYY